VTSYAVSPLTSFTCPPCSIRCPRTTVTPSQRFTYRSTTSSKGSIQCFQQATTQDYEVTKSSIDTPKSSSPIVHLDAFVGDGGDKTQFKVNLLAVHEDGVVRCYSERLEKELWNTSICTISEDAGSEDGLRVENACSMRLDQARKALLRGREDLLATIPGEKDHDAITVLILFMRPCAGEDRPLILKVMRIDSMDSDHGIMQVGRTKPLQEISRMIVPEPAWMKKEETYLSFHSTSGTLYQSSSDYLAVYEILGMVPRLAQETRLNLNGVTACLRISSSLVMVNTASLLTILDARYFSVQAQSSLQKSQHIEPFTPSTKKRKHHVTPPSVQLLSYFASLDIVVALQGRQLVALQLTTSQTKGSRKRKRDVLLIDSIGRGSLTAKKIKSNSTVGKDHHSFGQFVNASPVDDEWTKTKLDLDRCFAEGEHKELGTLIDKQLKAIRRSTNHSQKTGSSNKPPAARNSWLDQTKVDYLLSKGFLVEADHVYPAPDGKGLPKTLRIHKLPHRSWRWLINHNYLSTVQVEGALRREDLLAAGDHLKVGAVFDSLAQQDPTLGTTLLLLRSATPLTASEIVCALRLPITQSGDFTTMKLLTYGPSPTHSSNNDAGTDPQTQIDDLQDTQTSPLTPAHPHHNAHAVLLTSLKRLYLQPPHALSTARPAQRSRPASRPPLLPPPPHLPTRPRSSLPHRTHPLQRPRQHRHRRLAHPPIHLRLPNRSLRNNFPHESRDLGRARRHHGSHLPARHAQRDAPLREELRLHEVKPTNAADGTGAAEEEEDAGGNWGRGGDFERAGEDGGG